MMLITRSQFALPTSPDLNDHAAQFWRVIGWSTQHVWLVATFSIGSHFGAVTETVCAARDTDLVNRIESFPMGRITRLVALLPPWQTGGEGWISRRIESIWRGRHGVDESFVFIDSNGIELCCDLLGHRPSAVRDR